jgi:hypothetical protein
MATKRGSDRRNVHPKRERYRLSRFGDAIGSDLDTPPLYALPG